MQVKSPYTGIWWELRDKAGKPVSAGTEFTERDGAVVTLKQGHPPKHPASSGHVTTSDPRRGYDRFVYAHVYDLKWHVLDPQPSAPPPKEAA